MNRIPQKLSKQLASDPEYQICALRGHGMCDGHITWEHALYFSGKQIQERFSIVPLCELHHNVNRYQDYGTFNKELSAWVALNRATDQELKSISKVTDYIRMRDRLNEKYGVYKPVEKLVSISV